MIQTEMLFQSRIISFGYKEYSLETYADRGAFRSWKAREGCADTDEMRAGLNIDGILRSADPSESEVLTYIQYVLNIAELARRSFNREMEQGYDFDIRNYTQLLTGARDLLKTLHYETKYVPSKELIYIVPHDPAADLIADEPESPYAAAVTEYRSVLSSGDLARKRALLTQLGEMVESYPDNLKAKNAVLYSRIEFLLNNVHIRTDNQTGGDRVERVAGMDARELEEWYDETYRLLLVRILGRMAEEGIRRVDGLAADCGIGIEAVTQEEVDRLMDAFSGQDAEDFSAEELPARELPPGETFYEARPMPGTASAEEPRDADGDGLAVRNVILAILTAVILFAVFVFIYLHL